MELRSETIRLRIRQMRKRLRRDGIDCLILTKPENVTYLTGFRGEDSWAIIGPRSIELLTDSRYTEQARQECLGCRIVQRTLPIAQAAAKLLSKRSSIDAVAIEQTTSVELTRLVRKHLGRSLKSLPDRIGPLRSIKDDYEIRMIRKAAAIAADALQRSLPHLSIGMTESTLAGLLDFQIRKLDATNSFPTIVAFGSNASRPHHQPGRRRLRTHDTILIDFGARYRGYCCDITRCFVVGKPTALFRKVYAAVRQAQSAAVKTVTAGARLVDVDSAAREAVRNANLPVYGHGTGHGFGLEIHEQPFLSAQVKGILRAGQVITIEPGVYMPGKLGVRIEDDVLVTETGCRILTRGCPKTPELKLPRRPKPIP